MHNMRYRNTAPVPLFVKVECMVTNKNVKYLEKSVPLLDK